MDDELFKILVAAFSGAFFAYLFGRLADLLTAIYVRKKNHYNELIYLERIYNTHLSINYDNIALLEKLSATLEQGKLEVSVFSNYEIPESSLMKVVDINYLNELLTYFVNLRKVNHDLSLTESWNNELRAAVINKNIDHGKYCDQANNLAQNVNVLVDFLRLLDDKIITLLSINKIHIKNSRTLLSRILRNRSITIKESEVAMNKEMFLEEIKSNIQKEGKEINEIIKGSIFDSSHADK